MSLVAERNCGLERRSSGARSVARRRPTRKIGRHCSALRPDRARRSRKCHQNTAPIRNHYRTISTTSKAEFSIQAIAGMPSAMIRPSRQDLPGQDLHAGGKGAEREQGEDRQCRGGGGEKPLYARQQQHVHDQDEREPVQRLVTISRNRAVLSVASCHPYPTQTSAMIGARISQ